MTKGVKVEVGTEEYAVDLNIIVKYGVKFLKLCENIHRGSEKGIETMTGLGVVEINIHVQGVELEKKGEAATEATAEQAPRVR